MPWTNIMPSGGVEPTKENLSAWFKAGAFCVGMGSNLITKDVIKNNNYKLLEENIKKTLKILESIR
jgi:2-dehydro-3-deoxyphosphogluconate aldolase/(4S)-4-hydroxy-2-oxoglutarate aldolase